MLALLDHGAKVHLIDNLSNSFVRVFDHMKRLAGDKASQMTFTQVCRLPPTLLLGDGRHADAVAAAKACRLPRPTVIPPAARTPLRLLLLPAPPHTAPCASPPPTPQPPKPAHALLGKMCGTPAVLWMAGMRGCHTCSPSHPPHPCAVRHQ